VISRTRGVPATRQRNIGNEERPHARAFRTTPQRAMIRKRLVIAAAALAAVNIVGVPAVRGLLQRTQEAVRAEAVLSDLESRILRAPLLARRLVTARRQGRQNLVRDVLAELEVQYSTVERLASQLTDLPELSIVAPESAAGAGESFLGRLGRFKVDLQQLARNIRTPEEEKFAVLAGGLARTLNLAAVHARERALRNATSAVWTAGVVGLLDVFAALALPFLLVRTVLRPLEEMTDTVRALVRGGLESDVRLPCERTDEIGATAAVLNQLVDQFREASRVKDRFLANMSHEIRTPLNGILGFLENLAETELNEQQRQYLRVLQSSARGLLRVVNDILDFSKISAGRLELEHVAFDVAAVAEESVALARQLARGKPVDVVLDMQEQDHTVVRGDPTRLRQVLNNLLSNAVKFTEQGEVRLTLTFDREDDKHLGITFTVSDTGIGIRPDQQKRLFRAFAQAEPGIARRYGGTGLGLYIAWNLVSMMGGALRVESHPGKGTRFWFRLVMETAPVEEQVRYSTQFDIVFPPRALRKYWVLVVDDNPTNLYLMETICQSIGLPYMTARNGREAVELVQKHHFDLIFMDIQMPVMDGYTATRKIREIEGAADTQIVALTASAMQEDVERALGAGSTGFLAKPFERNQLLQCIAEYLGVPYERRPRETPEVVETSADVRVRRAYDFMREQYQVSLGEIKLILAQSVANWRPRLEDLRVFAKRNDWERVRPLLHELKGQLGAIGLAEFAEAADRLGAAVRADAVEDVHEEIERFVQELSEVFRRLEENTSLPERDAGTPG